MKDVYLQHKFNERLKVIAIIISAVIILISIGIYFARIEFGELQQANGQWIYISVFFLISTLLSWKYESIGGIITAVGVIVINELLAMKIINTAIVIGYSFLVFPATIFIVVSALRRVQKKFIANIDGLKEEYGRLEQDYNITKTMMEITPSLLVNDDFDVLLDNIIKKAVEVVPRAQAGSILILNKDKMEFKAAEGYDLEKLKKVTLLVEETFQYKLGVKKDPLVIKDLSAFHESNLKSNVTGRLRKQNQLSAKSILTCAIYYENKMYGSINLDNLDDYDAFKEEDKKHIKHLATHIEVAIKNQKLVESIYKLSRYDALTGLFARKHHEELLEDVIGEAKDKKTEFSICVVDINNLKRINDKYGHSQGDKYLIHFSNLIKRKLTKHDIAARTGGDEFSIVYRYKGCEDAAARIREIREYIFTQPFKIGDVEFNIDFGCGISCYPDDGTDIKKLSNLSDKRMYEDKKKRKAESRKKYQEQSIK